MTFLLPQVSQEHSRLLTLPAELRNIIFDLALSAMQPLVNPVPLRPSFHDSERSKDPWLKSKHSVPPLGTALLRTCQLLYTTISFTPLFANSLVFTRPSYLAAFTGSLPYHLCHNVTCITISTRETTFHPIPPGRECHSPLRTDANVALREWMHFFSCPPSGAHCPGVWCARLPTLTTAAPCCEHLIVDLEGLSQNLPVEMAQLGIKTDFAKGLGELLGNIGQRFSSCRGAVDEAGEDAGDVFVPGARKRRRLAGRGLRRIEVTGFGAHLWDVGDLMRPTVWGEWQTVGRWVDIVGRGVVPCLIDAVRPNPERRITPEEDVTVVGGPMDMIYADGRRWSRSRSADVEGTMKQILQQADELGEWVGILWRQNRFSLAAMDEAPADKDILASGYEHAMSWREITA